MKTIHISDNLCNKIKIAQSKMNEIHTHPLRYYYILEEIVKELDVKEYNKYIDPHYFSERYCEDVINGAECM